MALGLPRRVLVLGLLAGCFAVLPVARDDLGHATATLTAAFTAIVLCDVLVAGLLVARFVARGSALPLVLGCSFLLAAVVAAARALVLPGVGADGRAVHAAGQAPEWLWTVGHLGVPLGVAVALWGGPAALRRALASPTLRRPATAAGAGLATTVAGAVLAAATVLLGRRLPAAVAGGHLTALGLVAGGATALVTIVVLVVVARRSRRGGLERWLTAVVACRLAGTLLTLAGQGRYTGGWYAGMVLDLAASALVLVVLLAEPSQLGHARGVDPRATARDPLTGVASRAAALVTAEHLHRTRAPSAPLAVILLDVDALRAIEDAHGALAADAVMLTVAERLRALLRDEDVLARAGEEGFLIVLPGTDADGATLVADRAVAAVRDQPVGTWAHDVRTTASGGVAMVGDGEHAVAHALTAADLALNQAKAHGRDQVVSPARALVVPLRRAAAGPPPR